MRDRVEDARAAQRTGALVDGLDRGAVLRGTNAPMTATGVGIETWKRTPDGMTPRRAAGRTSRRTRGGIRVAEVGEGQVGGRHRAVERERSKVEHVADLERRCRRRARGRRCRRSGRSGTGSSRSARRPRRRGCAGVTAEVLGRDAEHGLGVGLVDAADEVGAGHGRRGSGGVVMVGSFVEAPRVRQPARSRASRPRAPDGARVPSVRARVHAHSGRRAHERSHHDGSTGHRAPRRSRGCTSTDVEKPFDQTNGVVDFDVEDKHDATDVEADHPREGRRLEHRSTPASPEAAGSDPLRLLRPREPSASSGRGAAAGLRTRPAGRSTSRGTTRWRCCSRSSSRLRCVGCPAERLAV